MKKYQKTSIVVLQFDPKDPITTSSPTYTMEESDDKGVWLDGWSDGIGGNV